MGGPAGLRDSVAGARARLSGRDGSRTTRPSSPRLCGHSARASCRRSGTGCASSSCRCCCLAGALDEKYVAAGERMASLLPRGEFARDRRAPGTRPSSRTLTRSRLALRDFLDESL